MVKFTGLDSLDHGGYLRARVEEGRTGPVEMFRGGGSVRPLQRTAFPWSGVCRGSVAERGVFRCWAWPSEMITRSSIWWVALRGCLLVGDGTVPSGAEVEVPIMDDLAAFTGDFVLDIDRAW